MITLQKVGNRHQLLCLEGEAIALAMNLEQTGTAKNPSVRLASMAEVSVYNPAEYHDGLGGYMIEWTETMNPSIENPPTGDPSEDDLRRSVPVRFSLNAAINYRRWNETPQARWQKNLTSGVGIGDIYRK